jgi:hypothetical protein
MIEQSVLSYLFTIFKTICFTFLNDLFFTFNLMIYTMIYKETMTIRQVFKFDKVAWPVKVMASKEKLCF